MKPKLHFMLWQSLLLTMVLLMCQSTEAQCSDNFIRPSDSFQLQGWSPRCHNGTDGEIRITNIASTIGQGDFTNQNYAVRILSGPNAPRTIPITANSATFTLSGLTSGTYVLDIIDQCGGNSADKTITLVNPPLNSTLAPTTYILKDKTNNPEYSVCGNMLKYRMTITTTSTAGDITCVFTNNEGNTLSFSKAVNRVAQPVNKIEFLDIVIPIAFFNNQNITYSVSNMCGLLSGGTLALPLTSDIVYGIPSIIDTSDPQNACLIGYDIKVFRDFMTNPITITVEETANPGVTPLNFIGEPISPRVVNLLHLNSVPMGMATAVPLGLKYNTHYNITFTDACGLTVTKTMGQTITPFNPTISCGTDSSINDVPGYFDDAALIKYNGVAISSNAVGPLTVTINSGPSNYTTSSGSGNTITSRIIQYPYSTTIPSPFLNDYISINGIRTFPPGLYNITITDACGKNSTFDYNVSCSRNSNISHALLTCEMVTQENIGVKLFIPKGLLGTKATIYKANGTVAATGIINSGSPFYYVASSSYGTLTLNLPNNTEYYFRYGGVTETGNLTEPIQFGGNGALPRVQGGYLYEYYFKTELTPFRFEAIQACGTSVSMTASGGTAPYTFTVLDASGNAQLFPNQSSASFSGLITGMLYTAKAIDACGREFTQQFEVFPLPVATLDTIVHPGCQTNWGSVTIKNLPSDWTITMNPGNVVYHNTTASFTINNLSPGNYTFSVQDNITTCTENQFLSITINSQPICPIASNDTGNYTSGIPFIINVLENDTTGAVVNPAAVSLVAQSNSTNIVSNNGLIVSMDIPNEGSWIVNPTTGQISFHPLTTFNGTPSIIEYNVRDFNGNISNNATIVLDFLPIAVDDTSYYSPGSPVTINIIGNDVLGDHVNPSSISLILAENPDQNTHDNPTQQIQLDVYREGTWSIDTDAGTATFTPLPGFTGVPTIQQYRVRDFEGNLSNIAFIRLKKSCTFQVTCPTFPNTTVACYNDIPTATQLTKTEFEMLGNGNGSIGNTPCGIIEITASNSPYTGCNTSIQRTYQITEFQDTNANGRRDPGENTILNATTCSQLININDTTPPVFNETLPLDSRVNCNAIRPAIPLTATDNCSNATVTFNETRVDGNCPNNYTLIRTWTATDTCGNAATHTQTINVEDTTAPVFNGVLPSNITLECNNLEPAAILTATDNCGNATVTFNETRTDGNCPNNYILTRTWSASDACGNTATHTQIINIEDTTPPVFNETLPLDSRINCNAIRPATPLTATDNCGNATVTFNETRVDGSCPNNYILTRTWTASDACGNTATHTQIINVEDTTPPVFSGVLPSNITVECNNLESAAILTATDNCGNATVTFNETRTDGSCPNNYVITRTWNASDACGNTVSHTQIVNVQDTTLPVFNEVLPLNSTVECNSIIPAPVTLTATDNCGTAGVLFEEETINGNCPGNIEIVRTWRAVDACGNENIHIQTITVNDTTPPVFDGILPQNQTLECSNIPVAQTLTATDSCGEVTVSFEENEVEGDCKSKYQLIRTWTATDSCGNTATHTQTLNLNCHVKVFNAVSPDGDGSNDIFYLEGIECFPNNSVEIFNRWGAKVFDTQGYDNTTNVFRGRSEGRNTISKNEDLPTGTYFYVLRYDFNSDGNQNEKIEKTGYLYVVNK